MFQDISYDRLSLNVGVSVIRDVHLYLFTPETRCTTYGSVPPPSFVSWVRRLRLVTFPFLGLYRDLERTVSFTRRREDFRSSFLYILTSGLPKEGKSREDPVTCKDRRHLYNPHTLHSVPSLTTWGKMWVPSRISGFY